MQFTLNEMQNFITIDELPYEELTFIIQQLVTPFYIYRTTSVLLLTCAVFSEMQRIFKLSAHTNINTPNKNTLSQIWYKHTHKHTSCILFCLYFHFIFLTPLVFSSLGLQCFWVMLLKGPVYSVRIACPTVEQLKKTLLTSSKGGEAASDHF